MRILRHLTKSPPVVFNISAGIPSHDADLLVLNWSIVLLIFLVTDRFIQFLISVILIQQIKDFVVDVIIEI